MPPTPFERAVALMDRDRYDEAIAAFTQAVEADDRAALALSKRGVCRVRTGDRPGASRDFAAALDRDPHCVPALINLGNMALEANMLEEARARYASAAALDDRSPAAHHNLGVVYRRLGRMADSVRELRRAATLELDPARIVAKIKAMWKRR